jgi:capsular polysaccharide biosynthesis protein
VTSETPLQQLLRALVRFWWVALLGIVLAGLAFTFATYTVKLGLPPKLTARTQPTYSASTQMLVTSKRDPNLSASNVNAKVIPLGNGTAATAATSTTTGTAATGPTYTYDSSGGADGDLQRLDEIANNLPPRVTSDPVVKLRNQMFGRINGTVTAVNPYAFSGAGGFRSGPLPYIQINGTADSPQDAVAITNQTAVAFKKWFEARQVVNKIPTANRVVVEQVNSADHASANGGTKPLLGVAAALLVLLGGSGLALALDRLIPRRRPRAARVAVPAASERTLPISEPVMPALEVPTMTLGAHIEDVVTGETTKRAPRPRKQASNGTSNGSAPRRRRATTSTPRVAPNTEDAG